MLCLNPTSTLLRCLFIKEKRNKGKYYIGQPCRQSRRPVCIDGKSRRHGLKQNIRSAQSQSYTQIQSHTAFPLPRRKGKTDNRQNKRSKGGGKPFLILHLERFHIARATGTLLDDIFFQFRTGQGFLLVSCQQEIRRFMAMMESILEPWEMYSRMPFSSRSV